MKGNIIVTDELFKAGRPGESPREIDSVFCAQNDRASFQILVDSENESCRVNTGDAPALGLHIGRPVCRISVHAPFETDTYTEGYLRDANGISYADILDGQPVKDYDGSVFPAVWTDVRIPENAQPGNYKITIDAYLSTGAADETHTAHREIALTVYPRALPTPENYRIYLDLWQHNSNLARYYGVELWSDEHFEILEKAIQTLAELGQKSAMILLGDCPWRGWGCYLMPSTPAELYEYSMARVVKKADGSFLYDFSAVERYVKLCEKYSISGDISVYGLLGIWKMPFFPAIKTDLPEQVLIRYLDEKDGCYRYMTNETEFAAYLGAVFSFFKEKGWSDRVLISGDEPSDMTAYRRSAEFIRKIEPDVRFKLALDHASVIEEFAGSLHCCAASFPCSCNQRDFLLKFKEEKRGKLLFYVCNIPDKPNTVLKSALFESVFLGVLAYRLGFDGFLRWAHYCWTVDPRREIRYNDMGLPAGDVCFVYPDKRGGFLLSLRYKALQRGIQIFEMLKRLPEETARRLTEEVLPVSDFSAFMRDDRHTADGIFPTDPDIYLRFRKALIAAYSEADS